MDKYWQQINRAQMLIAQGRREMAEQTLQSAIAEEPERGLAYSILAIVEVGAEKYDDAQRLAERGLHLEPDNPFGHYAVSQVMHQRGKYKEAHAAIDAAIQFDPSDADYHAHKAQIFKAEMKWKLAIDSAEAGLMFEPEHDLCINLRAVALTKLGRTDEASSALDSALANNPEDAFSHANVGWNELRQGRPNEAAEHFREALRLEPDNEWARQGILESLKARNWFYRQVLRSMFWMTQFTPKTQMMMFVGVIVVLQFLVRMPQDSALSTVGVLLAFGYVIFISVSWLAKPIFNLLLRFDSFGRLVLNPNEVADTNYTAIALVLCAVLCWPPIYTGFRTVDVINYVLLLLAAAVCLSTPREARRKQAALATCGIWVVAIYFWYRWYFNTGIEGLEGFNAIGTLIDTNAEVAPATEVAIIEFAKEQSNLHSIFTWGTVIMTWAASYFGTRVR